MNLPKYCRLSPLHLLALVVVHQEAYADSTPKQFHAYKNETVVCGASWSSGRWREPVAVLLKQIGDRSWVGWIDMHVYSVEAVKLGVKHESFGQIFLEGDSKYGVSFVLVLQDGQVEIRTRNFDTNGEDSASGYCRQLGTEQFSVEIEERHRTD